MTNNFSVYKHTSPSGKIYIGITCQDANRRWRGDGSGYRANPHFLNAIKKYGWDNFEHSILFENLTKEQACRIEKVLIQIYESYKMSKGYNRSLGGEHGNLSEEAKQHISEVMCEKWKDAEYAKHMSEAHKGKICSQGWTHTDEAKDKLSAISKKRWASEEYRKKWLASRKEKYANSPEWQKNCSKAAKKMWEDPEYRKRASEHAIGNKWRAKKVINLDTGEVFASQKEAAQSVGLSRGCSIGYSCKSSTVTAGGYRWAYYDDE